MKKILVVLMGLIFLVAGGGLLLPGTIHLEREIEMNARQGAVLALLSSHVRFNDWSPWAKIDPEGTTYEYSGPREGVGAKMAWTSEHRDVGTGSQEITAINSDSEVLSALDFGQQGKAESFFRLSPGESGGTKVVWGFDSDLGANPIGRIFGYFFLGGILGPQYEQGLADLKTLAEGLPQADWSDIEMERVEVEPVTLAYVSGSSSLDSAEIGQAFGKSYGQVMAFISTHSLSMAGAPLSINKKWDETYEYDAGIPIAVAPESVPEDSEVQIAQTYSGKIVKAVHTGAYADLEQTYDKIDAYLAAYGLEKNGYPWDAWMNDPSSTPEAELITHVHYPIK